ncbi:MAG: acetate--CoA ligase family protein [Candidatus Pacearchaeota archaeon]
MVVDLAGFFKPTSVAVVGASRNPAKVGHVILKNLIDGGFKGAIYPINPEADNILGYRVYPTLEKVAEMIDLAVIAVPAELVLKTIDECKKKKIRDVLIITAGFGEVGNQELEEKLKAKLDAYGMNCVGVNCLGIFDAYHKFDTLFLPRYRLTRPKPGGISFICQSGAIGSAILDIASTSGYTFSKFVSYGNATQIDETDLLEYMGSDETTKVICMYVEGIKNGEKFFETIKKVSAHKPVIVLKGGLTEAGKKATISHTGSLAGDSSVFFGILTQTNAIRANSLEEMFHIAALVEKGVQFKSNRLQIITNGGGYGILSTDAIADSKHVKLATLSPQTNSEIKKFAPGHMNIGNPLDLLGDATTERYKQALEVCLKDSGVDGILLIALYQTPLLTTEIVEVITECHRNSQKPIVVVSTGGEFTELLSRSLRERGVCVFSFPDEAITALDKLIAYQLRIPQHAKVVDKPVKSVKEKNIVKKIAKKKVKATKKK